MRFPRKVGKANVRPATLPSKAADRRTVCGVKHDRGQPKMISVFIVLGVVLLYKFLLFDLLGARGKCLKNGLVIMTSGAILALVVKFFGVSLVSLRYGVVVERVDDSHMAYEICFFATIVGCILSIIGALLSLRNA